MIERIRRLLPGQRPDPKVSTRRVSRREREDQQRRILYIAMATVATLVVALLAGGAIWEFLIQPRQVLASVSGTNITRGDYWKVRKFQLGSQISQYQFFAAQNPQYASIIQQLQVDLQNVKTDPADPATVESMVDDLVVQQNLGDLGLQITETDIQNYIYDNFAPGLINTPTATTTVNPTVAAWTTETAVAAQATATAQANATPRAATPGTPGTPGGTTGTPGTPAATPVASATPEGTPGTPAPSGTPVLTPTATIGRDQAIATATVGYANYLEDLDEAVGMSREDYARLVARPQIARQKVTDKLNGEIKDVQPQAHAVHILLATKEGADQARQQILQDPNSFATVAAQQSTDTSTGPNGGDLGWFPRGVMVKEFEDVAFTIPLNQVSEPVQSKFGWHLIKVIEREDNRPLTQEMLQSIKEGAFQKWLDNEKIGMTINSSVSTSPTPVAEPFTAPPGAPAPPTPTVAPLPTPFPITPAPSTAPSSAPSPSGQP